MCQIHESHRGADHLEPGTKKFTLCPGHVRCMGHQRDAGDVLRQQQLRHVPRIFCGVTRLTFGPSHGHAPFTGGLYTPVASAGVLVPALPQPMPPLKASGRPLCVANQAP